jgi:glycosyltransferase involved in cell wall biosynthesis
VPLNPPAVTYCGYAISESGYGTAARAYIAALHSAGVPTQVVCVDRMPQWTVTDALARWYSEPRYAQSVPLWHVEPTQLRRLSSRYPRAIGITTWETDRLPQPYVDALNRLGEVWVPSVFNEQTFRRQLSVPVFRLPHPVRTVRPPQVDRATLDRALGLPPESFVFATIGTWQERKNLPAVIEAFVRAFPQEPRAHLAVKTAFTFVGPAMAQEQIADAIHRACPPDFAQAADRIHIYSKSWSTPCIDAFAARADCYVTLHRGEGWCYPLFDAACAGIPVIATAGSGPMDYLDAQHHRLVRAELVPLGRHYAGPHFSFNNDMLWHEPDVEHAATLMREVYEQRDSVRVQAQAAATLLRARYASESVGRSAAVRLAEFVHQASLVRLLASQASQAPAHL